MALSAFGVNFLFVVFLVPAFVNVLVGTLKSNGLFLSELALLDLLRLSGVLGMGLVFFRPVSSLFDDLPTGLVVLGPLLLLLCLSHHWYVDLNPGWYPDFVLFYLFDLSLFWNQRSL